MSRRGAEARTPRDSGYAQVAQALRSARQSPNPAAEAVSPKAPEWSGSQSLESCLQRAVAQNPGIQAARARVAAAAMQIPQAASLGDPMLDVTGWPILPNAPQTASGRMTVDVMVSQQVPWPGKLATRGAEAQAEFTAARAALSARVLETIEGVKLAYFDLYLAQQSIRILEQDTRFLDDLIEVAQSRYRTGSTSQQDVLRLQAERSNLDGELIRLRQNQVEAQAELAAVLHLSPETPLAAVEQLPGDDLPADLGRLYQQAIAARPELHALLAEICAGRQRVELAHLAYRPDLTFKLGWGDMTTDQAIAPSADGIDNLTAGVSLNLPVYGGRLDAAVRQAEAETVATAREYDLAKDKTQRRVRQRFVQASSQRDLAHLLADSVIPKTEQAFQIALREYQVGEAEFADLLSAWRELLRYHLASFQLDNEFRKSLASLERLVGGWTSPAVEEVPVVTPVAEDGP